MIREDHDPAAPRSLRREEDAEELWQYFVALPGIGATVLFVAIAALGRLWGTVVALAFGLLVCALLVLAHRASRQSED